MTRVTSTSTTDPAYLSADGMSLTVTPGSGNVNYIYEARYFAWAGSNIYYDGSKLTFDAAGVTTNEMYQGLFFKWGSLVGISPVGANTSWNGTSTNSQCVYVPTGGTGWSQDYPGEASSPYSSYANWDNIPYISSGTGAYAAGQLAVSISDATEANAYNAKTGDICKYLSATGAVTGKWRLPTSYEFQLEGGTSTSWDNNVTWAQDGTFSDVTSSTSSSYVNGKFVNSTNNPRAIQSHPNKTSPSRTTSFPASGYRTSVGPLFYVGRYGYNWSGSAHSSSVYAMYYSSSNVRSADINNRTSGYAVRCVRE